MLLIIDNYDSFTYNLYQTVALFYQDIKVVRNDKITVTEVINLKPKAIILSPGPGRPEDAGICVELILYLLNHDINIPLLGVCLGHQAIVVASGGEVIQADTINHGKDDLIYHKQQGIYRNMPNPFKAARYHSLIANSNNLPDCLIVESLNNKQVIMGVKHVTKSIFGVQFHPESILTPKGYILIQDFMHLNLAKYLRLCQNLSASNLE